MEEERKLSAEELAELRRQLKNEARNAESAVVEQGDGEDKASEKKEEKIITVTIAEDMMSASVRLAVPLGDALYTVPEIIKALRENRVVLGIQSDVIMDMVNYGQYEEDTVVAVGKEVVPGTEGYYEFVVDMEVRKTPLIREDGTVDYSSVGKLTNVATGDKIAIYHPAVQGIKGYNVCGAELLPKFAKELPVLRGKYIEHNEDNEYFATIDGRISYSNYNVEILNVYEINSDITMNNGIVEFYGDIIINGNVETGSMIRAGRNITINGTVANARISAGGDIILSKGVQGAGLGRITTRGSVFADFIEYVQIEAAADVSANYILESDIKAGGKITVDGTKGSIIGGTTFGLMGIELRNAGTRVEQKTVLHAGFQKEDYNRFAELSKVEKEINADLASVVAEITDLLKIGKSRGVTGQQKERILELNRQKDNAYRRLDRIAEDKKILGEKMSKSANVAIVIKGDAHRNTIISIDVAHIVLDRTESHLKYMCRNNIIERRTI